MKTQISAPSIVSPLRVKIPLTPRGIAILLLLMLAASYCTLLLVGCANQTPGRTAFVTVAGATAAVNGVADAATLDPKFKAQLPKLLPFLDAVKKAQDDVDAAIAAKSVNITTVGLALNDAVTNLLNAKANATAATTQP